MEIGFTPSGDLSITKVDNNGGSSITSQCRVSHPGTIDHLHDHRRQCRSDECRRCTSDRCRWPSIPPSARTHGRLSAPAAPRDSAPSGTGSISDSVNIPAGGFVTYTVVAAIKSSASGTLANTASITSTTGIHRCQPGKQHRHRH